MIDSKKYATLLLDYCLTVRPGDTLLIRSTILAEPLLQELQVQAASRGVITAFEISFEGQDRLFYENATDDLLESTPPLYQHAVESFDCLLNIRAPHNTRELQHISSEKKQARAASLAPVKKTFMTRSANKELRWSLCVYPTESAAKECGMTLEAYTQFVLEACALNQENPAQFWLDLRARQDKLVNYLNKVNQVHITGPNGTDITFSLRDRTWINSDGTRNMPSGEVFTSPEEDSAQGTIYFSYPTLHNGTDVEGITLTYDKGELTKWHAKVGQSALDEAFSIDGSRRVGELAIGTNTQIQRATKNILFDEKIGGSIHMAVGASYPETGGKNESALHWDMITDMRDGGRIEADGVLIYENGSFVGDLA